MNGLPLMIAFVLVPYGVVVIVVYATCVLAWKKFRFENRDGLMLLAPPVLYASLEWWRDRQSYLFVHATLIVAIVVALALPLKVFMRGRSALPLIAAIGCCAAVLSWLCIPTPPSVMSDPFTLP
jgi:hypothetical protein